MDFKFTSSFHIEDSEIARMKRQVNEGDSPKIVAIRWSEHLENKDYWLFRLVEEDVMKEISKRA